MGDALAREIPPYSSHDPAALVGEVALVLASAPPLASEAGNTRSIPTIAAVS